jgi:hypothetical protein
MQQVIYLQPEDDMPAISHLLEGAQARRVLLVLPKGLVTLRNPVNARLLRRQAADLALDVALVTRDSRTRQTAQDEGVAVVSSIRQGKRDRWRSGTPRYTAAERAAAARVDGLRRGRGDRGYGDAVIVWAGRILAVLLFFLFLAVIVGLAALVVPEAWVTVVPLRESAEVTLELRADLEVEKPSLSQRTVPARLVEAEVEQTGEIATVSTKDAPDAPATGTVMLISEVASAQEILPGAIVRTSTGTTIRFKTTTTATLPASIGATAEAEIEALEPGPVGNVAAATITVVETAPLRGKIRVINESPTKGGGVRQVGVVTRADMDRLKAQLLQQLQQRAYTDLLAQLGENEFLPPESMTVEILSEVYDQFLDAEADVLHLQMRIYSSGTAVDRSNAQLLAFQALEEVVPSAYLLTTEEISFGVDEDARMDGRSVIFEASASVPLVADVEHGAVRSLVAGLTVEEAVEVLSDSFALDAPPEVVVEPDWIKRWEWLDRVPFLPFRIQVVVLK